MQYRSLTWSPRNQVHSHAHNSHDSPAPPQRRIDFRARGSGEDVDGQERLDARLRLVDDLWDAQVDGDTTHLAREGGRQAADRDLGAGPGCRRFRWVDSGPVYNGPDEDAVYFQRFTTLR